MYFRGLENLSLHFLYKKHLRKWRDCKNVKKHARHQEYHRKVVPCV